MVGLVISNDAAARSGCQNGEAFVASFLVLVKRGERVNWYSLYVDGLEKATDVTLDAAQRNACSFMSANHLLRIAYGDPTHIIRAWRYDNDKQAWLNDVASSG